MIVLGLHVGHDGSAAIVDDGIVVGLLERERVTRSKHAIGVRGSDIAVLLSEFGLSVDDIDLCAVTSTQGIELVSFDDDLIIDDGPPHPFLDVPAGLADRSFWSNGWTGLRRAVRTPGHRYADRLTPTERQTLGDRPFLPSVERFGSLPSWELPLPLADRLASPLVEALEVPDFHLRFHRQLLVRLFGRAIPGCVVSHHVAHAAAAFFTSPFDSALILSHDGGRPVGIESGLLALGRGHELTPLGPHHMALGSVYDTIARRLGLGYSAAGKLMGLAPYGRPTDSAGQGALNHFDVGCAEGEDARWWTERWLTMAGAAEDDLTRSIAAGVEVPGPAADLAASTQALLESTYDGAVSAALSTLERAGVHVDGVCLSGGASLNCPANSRIAQRLGAERVYVPPFPHDGGLSAGAALHLTHSVLKRRRTQGGAMSAFLGRPLTDTESVIGSNRIPRGVLVERPADAAARAAADLASGKIIGWVDGRSEVGPRALGHRSILADPRDASMWRRVNQVKGREQWRPFAPMVLEEAYPHLFRGVFPSPHMLFTHRVEGDALPAVTHVDQTSRVQTVNSSVGSAHRVLTEFARLTGVGAVLNTSFNGPGEPIVETAGDAMRSFLRLGLDALYLSDQYRITAPRR